MAPWTSGESDRSSMREAGLVTVEPLKDLARPADSSWNAYLTLVGDVASQAPVMAVLAAEHRRQIAGCATVEVDDRRIGDEPSLRT